MVVVRSRAYQKNMPLYITYTMHFMLVTHVIWAIKPKCFRADLRHAYYDGLHIMLASDQASRLECALPGL
jgi:hypothetical protein